jgi:hypothetical protein
MPNAKIQTTRQITHLRQDLELASLAEKSGRLRRNRFQNFQVTTN